MVLKAVNWKTTKRPITFHMFNLKHSTFKMPSAFHSSIIWSHASLILRVWPLFTGGGIIIGIQSLGRSGQRPEFSQATGMALVCCILGKFLGVVCHCFPPLFRCSHFPRPPQHERSQRRKWELWARMLSGNFAEMTTSTPFRDLLHAANIRHGPTALLPLRRKVCWGFFRP